MVRTNNKSTKSKPKSAEAEVAEEATQAQPPDFEIDSDLLNPEYNQIRRPILPYGIIINDNPAGILIPEDQLEKAGWVTMPSEEELTTVTLSEDVTGLLLTKARILVLGFVPEYIRYKNDVPDVGNTIIGLYDEYRATFDKKTMDAVSEHALVFLDEDNHPLHSTPIVVRLKNVALWSFKAIREEFHRLLEKAFSDYFNVPFSGKNDKWRSLGIIDCQFKAIKEGEGNNKHWCCKTVKYTKPTAENLPSLFLGTPEQKTNIWQMHNGIAGFTETPALPAAEEPEVKVLPPPSRKSEKKTKASTSIPSKPPRKVEPVEEDDDFEDELDFEEESEFDDEDFEDDFSNDDDDDVQF